MFFWWVVKGRKFKWIFPETLVAIDVLLVGSRGGDRARTRRLLPVPRALGATSDSQVDPAFPSGAVECLNWLWYRSFLSLVCVPKWALAAAPLAVLFNILSTKSRPLGHLKKRIYLK
jgi:hypothetical protein